MTTSWAFSQPVARAVPRHDLEQVVGAEAAERHAEQMDAERRHIPDADEGALERPLQAPVRERENDVEEHHGRERGRT